MLLLAVVLLVGFVPLAAHLSGSVPTLIPEGPRVVVCGLAVQWLGLLWLSGRSKGRSADTVSGDNRSGLALLAELSRNWPRSARERLETWLVAAADPAQLGESLQGRLADGKPTIVVALESPGVGSEVRVAGTGDAAELTADAAKALWLPHRRTWFPPRELGRGLAGAGVPFVSLRGAGDGRPIDPAALAGLAQLILEVALRWAKHVGSVGREPR